MSRLRWVERLRWFAERLVLGGRFGSTSVAAGPGSSYAPLFAAESPEIDASPEQDGDAGCGRGSGACVGLTGATTRPPLAGYLQLYESTRRRSSEHIPDLGWEGR